MFATTSSGFRSALLICLGVPALLSGCGLGDGEAPTGTPSAAASASGTAVPTIRLSGTPSTDVVAGDPYAFQPTASTTGGTATFSVSGLPSWANFDPGTGAITGTPTRSNVGVTPDITISASDGTAIASLPPFKIDVTAPAGAVAGSASLSWSVPTLNTNGTPATDLAGYHIYYGTSPDALTSVIDVPGAETTEYEISNLVSGTYYFEVTAYNSLGVDSAASNQGSETIS
jgi:hypothetical protein